MQKRPKTMPGPIQIEISVINGEVNISHETTTMVLWIYDGI